MGILSVKGKHTNSEDEYEVNKKSDASLIFSDASSIEEFSIELSVGDQWAGDVSKEKAIMYAIEGGAISIKPRTSVVLEVKESMRVPFNMYGLVLQTGSIFLEQGILVGSGKIEPSFDGKLRLLVYNTSKTKRTLKAGQKIASAIFLRTDKTITRSIYNNSRDSVERNRSIYKKAVAFFAADIKFTLMFIGSLLTSSLTAAFFVHFASKPVHGDSEYQQVIEPTQKAPKTISGTGTGAINDENNETN